MFKKLSDVEETKPVWRHCTFPGQNATFPKIPGMKGTNWQVTKWLPPPYMGTNAHLAATKHGKREFLVITVLEEQVLLTPSPQGYQGKWQTNNVSNGVSARNLCWYWQVFLSGYIIRGFIASQSGSLALPNIPELLNSYYSSMKSPSAQTHQSGMCL